MIRRVGKSEITPTLNEYIDTLYGRLGYGVSVFVVSPRKVFVVNKNSTAVHTFQRGMLSTRYKMTGRDKQELMELQARDLREMNRSEDYEIDQ